MATPAAAIAPTLDSAFAISERTTLLKSSSRSKNPAASGRSGLALLSMAVDEAQSLAAHLSASHASLDASRIGGLDVGSEDLSPRTS